MKHRFFLLACIGTLVVVACRDATNPVTPPARARPSPLAPDHYVTATTPDIALVSIEVSGGEKVAEPMRYSIPLQDGKSLATFGIPAGKGYNLLIRGYDIYGDQTHEGNAVLDGLRSGVEVALSAPLASVAGGKEAQVDFSVRGEPLSGGGKIAVKAPSSLLEGDNVKIRAAVYDAFGSQLKLGPDDLHWTVNDPRAGWINALDPNTIQFVANTGGEYVLSARYRDLVYDFGFIIKRNPFVQISSGWDFTCGMRLNGSSSCWGYNFRGPLGVAAAPDNCEPFTPATCSAKLLAIPGRFASIAAGGRHVCGIGLLTAQTSCWGANFSGELGLGFTSISEPPTAIPNGPNFQKITAGGAHSCGITNGVAFCWGDNSNNELGLGAGAPSKLASPTQIPFSGASDVVAGNLFTCGINPGITAPEAKCWGRTTEGEIGNGFNPSSSPSLPTSVNQPFGSATPTLSVGMSWFTSCVVSSSADAWCWGENSHRQLGDPGTTASNSGVPVKVTGGHAFKSIATGQFHTCGVDSAGVVFCWGQNLEGRTGQPPTSVDDPTPRSVPIAGQLVGGVVASMRHTCALTTQGHIYCWGANDRGQLGVGVYSAGTNVPQRVIGS